MLPQKAEDGKNYIKYQVRPNALSIIVLIILCFIIMVFNYSETKRS